MKKKILSFILSLIIMIGTLSMTITATAIDTSVDTSAKLSEGLKQKMNEYADDEYIPIYVWLDSVGDDVVYQVLSKKAGTEITANTEDAYITSRIENKLDVYKKIELEKQSSIDVATMSAQAYSLKENVSVDEQITSFRNQLQIPAIMTDAEIKTCIESEMPIEKIIEVAERNQFLSDFRGSRKGLNEITNSAFENEIDKTKCQNIFVDPALPFVTMECKKSYIEILAQFTNVTEIGYHEEVEFTTDATEEAEIATQEEAVASTEESTSSTTTNPHIVSGNYLMTPHETLGYTGAGVKVGVLETNSYWTENIHLLGANIINRNSVSSNSINHATQVLSIICGQAISLGDFVYKGIAPRATVYFQNELYVENFSTAMNWFVNDKFTSVINLSLNTGEIREYGEDDQYLDCYVQQYRVIVVKSAGNQENVTSPGLAYNGITVGNVSNLIDASGKYIMQAGSGWYEYPNLANKPDLAAFGTNIEMINYKDNQSNAGTLWSSELANNERSGTSFSAPMVTGTVALMLQANPKLIGHPDAVKAILLQTAEENKISGENGNNLLYYDSNDPDPTLIKREKSGAGLLNIVGSINGAINARVKSISFDLSLANVNDTWVSDEYYFYANNPIEICLVFEKYIHTILTNATNTRVSISIWKRGETSSTFESNEPIENVLLFNYTFASAGYYSFRIKIDGLDSTTNDTIPTDLQAGHIQHNSLNVSFLFACDCDNFVPTTEHNTESYCKTKCATCNNNKVLFREPNQIYTYSEAFYFDDVSVLMTHRVAVRNIASIDESKTVFWKLLDPQFSVIGDNIFCMISSQESYYNAYGYVTEYTIDVYQSQILIGSFTTDSLLVINEDGNAAMLTSND